MCSTTRRYTASARRFFTRRRSRATVARCGMIVLASSPTAPARRPRIVSVGRNIKRSRYSSGKPDPELPLERRPVQRDPAEQRALGRGRRDRVRGQALDERRPVRRRHRGEQPRQDPGRVRHAEVPGVDVAAGGLELEGEREDAARAEHHRRPLAGVLRPVRDEDEVGRQEVLVRLDEIAEARAADLLLALEDELQIHPGRHAQRVHETERLEVRPDRPLVVGRPARVEPMGGERVVGDRVVGDDRRALLGQARA